MTTTGRVILKDKHGNPIQCGHFKGQGEANKLIEKWKKLYGKGWDKIEVTYEYDGPVFKEQSHFKKGSFIKQASIKRSTIRMRLSNYGE